MISCLERFSPVIQREIISMGKKLAVIATIATLAAITFLSFQALGIPFLQLAHLSAYDIFQLKYPLGSMVNFGITTFYAWLESLRSDLYRADNHAAFNRYFFRVVVCFGVAAVASMQSVAFLEALHN